MSVSQIVTVTVTPQSSFPTRESFESMLLFAYHAIPGPLVRTVSSLSDAADQGLTSVAYPDVYRALTVLFSQSPRPRQVKVGRRATAVVQSLLLTPVAPQGAGFVWWIEVDGVLIEYEEAGGDTVALIIDGLIAAVTAAAVGMATQDNITDFDLFSSVAGRVHRVEVDLDYITLQDDTPATNYATDLDAVEEFDAAWYGLAILGSSPAELAAASTWTEARTKLLVADVYESDVSDPLSTTDVAYALETAQRTRTATVWARGRVGDMYGGGYLAARLAAAEPGRATWHLKPIGGVETYGPIPESEQLALEAKQVNHLALISGVHRAINGVTAQGQFIDVTRTIDWLAARQREVILEILLAAPKIAYTDPDVAIIEGALRNFLLGAVAINVLAADPAPTVSVPLVADLSAAVRASRHLPDVVTTARLAGAVHTVDVTTILQF